LGDSLETILPSVSASEYRSAHAKPPNSVIVRCIHSADSARPVHPITSAVPDRPENVKPRNSESTKVPQFSVRPASSASLSRTARETKLPNPESAPDASLGDSQATVPPTASVSECRPAHTKQLNQQTRMEARSGDTQSAVSPIAPAPQCLPADAKKPNSETAKRVNSAGFPRPVHSITSAVQNRLKNTKSPYSGTAKVPQSSIHPASSANLPRATGNPKHPISESPKYARFGHSHAPARLIAPVPECPPTEAQPPNSENSRNVDSAVRPTSSALQIPRADVPPPETGSAKAPRSPIRPIPSMPILLRW
jgi:hypothetical protein